MIRTELATVLKMLSVNYSKTIDNSLIELWYDFFKDFELKTFQRTCQKIMSASEYFPKVSEVITAYRKLQELDKQAQYEKMKANQRLLAQAQTDCYLCDNKGFCVYKKNDYEYAARCICTYGKDLNKFSMAQIKPDYLPQIEPNYTFYQKKQIKDGKNPFYLKTINEMLGKDFLIFNAQQKEYYLNRKTLSNEEKLEVLKKLQI